MKGLKYMSCVMDGTANMCFMSVREGNPVEMIFCFYPACQNWQRECCCKCASEKATSFYL